MILTPEILREKVWIQKKRNSYIKVRFLNVKVKFISLGTETEFTNKLLVT